MYAFVTSSIDYCNGLLYGLPDCEIAKLQRVQNAAARLLTLSRKYDYITPVLQELHRLPVKFRIHFKILLLTFKALNGIGPAYISDLINVRKHAHYSLRSLNSGTLLLHAAGKMKRSFGDRPLSVSAPTLWNALPALLRNSSSIFILAFSICNALFNILMS